MSPDPQCCTSNLIPGARHPELTGHHCGNRIEHEWGERSDGRQRVAWCADKDNAQATATEILLELEALLDRDERIILGLGRVE